MPVVIRPAWLLWLGLLVGGPAALAANPPAVGANAGARRVPVQAAGPTATNAIRPTATAEVGDLGGKFFGRPPDPAKTRHYYIAVEPELWDYVPEGRDVVCGKPLPPALQAQPGAVKLRYVQYTDDSFTTRVMSEPRLGILGPVLRGVVGDHLAVTLFNRSARPVSMHPHGVRYDKDSEGAYYEPRPGRGAAIGSNATFTYVWQLDKNSGPRPTEPSSKAWLYHSHVRGDADANLGLVGFIVVTDPARARADGTPADVDREMAALFMMFAEGGEENENAEEEAAEAASSPTGAPPPKSWAQRQELAELGQRPAINGRLFGNLRGLDVNEGERVRWYLFALGSEEDFHTAHWHGLTVLEGNQHRTDVVELLPASMKIADMVADNPGAWLFHCHVAEHMSRGMFASFTVHPKNSPRVSREPAFFGLARAQASLQIKRAEGSVSAGDCRVVLEAECTVYQAFSVFVQPVTVQIGGRSLVFKPDQRGQSKVAGAEFQARNASPFGVIYGGTMQFEVTLTGQDWRAELSSLGLAATGTPAATTRVRVPVRVQIGKAIHQSIAELNCAFN